MKELEQILHCIMDVYNEDLSNDEKYSKVSLLWTKYYKLSSVLGIQLDFAYQLYLMCENECYKINQEPVLKEIDRDYLCYSIQHLKEVLHNRSLGIKDGISRAEALCLLNFVVNHVRNCFSSLGINLSRSSLNGFCELGQALSIMPFEKLGLQVTKNTASDAFKYPFNHAFGTVWFPILEDGEMIDERYLVDTTYRQFFSSVRCNEGRYYTLEENTGVIANPDPGYYVKNENFARTLMRDGYVLLNKENANFYGEAFYLSSLNLENKKMFDDRDFDYFDSILNNSSSYSITNSDLEGFEVDIFNVEDAIKKRG